MSAGPVYIFPLAKYEGANFSSSSTTLLIFHFITINITAFLVGMKLSLIVILICSFPVTNHAELLFMSWLVIYITSSEKRLFKSLWILDMIRYMICKYNLSFGGLSFHFIVSLDTQAFDFDDVYFIYFFFCHWYFAGHI